MRIKQLIAGVLTASLVIGSAAVPVFATEPTQNDVDAASVQVEDLDEENCLYSWPWEQTQYVLMNIPYDEFYAAEVNNSVEVDGVTSATLNKPRTGTLAGGSYHVSSDGSDITGITFPVKVTTKTLKALKEVTDEDSVSITVTNRGQTTTTVYSGKDALFENESYAYYVLDSEPAYYKEMRVNADGSYSFSAVRGEKQEMTGVTAELLTETNRGDYQINLEGLDLDTSSDQVYAVVLKTQEGTSYGLRHIENIWRGSELAFCTGFTTEIRNAATSSAHYESIMGQTVNQIVYYTSKGIYTIDTELYIPVKTADGTILPKEESTTTTTTNCPWKKFVNAITSIWG
jgi:hypothetical protein